MEKPKQEEIPKSIIKGGDVIRADLKFPQGTGTILFMSASCVVIGLNSLPYLLFVTPEFKDEILPIVIKKDIYFSKELVLQSSFLKKRQQQHVYILIPNWIKKFTKLEHLRLEYVAIDEFDSLKDLPIQRLTLENIKYNDSKKIISTIKQFKHLKEISYDQSFLTIIESLKGLNLTLIMINKVN